MAVQARHLSHSHAFSIRAMEDAAVAGTVLLSDYVVGCAPAAAPGTIGATTTVFSDGFPRCDLACDYGLEPRKRPRVVAGRFSDYQSVVMRPPAAPQVGDLQGRALGSGSGRLDNGASVSQSQGMLSRLYHQDVEIDALVRLETQIERIQAALEEARRRHARELLAAVERAASVRARAAEAELELALRRNAELEEKARQVSAECQAWMGVASSHEAVAAGLRATLDQLLLLSPSACAAPAPAVSVNEGAAAEDAQSCCGVEAPVPDDDADAASNEAAAASSSSSSSCRCKACGGGDACVLLLPCRHLCLCSSCEAAVDACPVCSAGKNASLHVLLR